MVAPRTNPAGSVIREPAESLRDYMLGQFLDPFAPAGGAVGIPFAGAVVVVFAAVEEVDVAALATAAPPPASKPAAASVATKGLIRVMFGSPPFVGLRDRAPHRCEFRQNGLRVPRTQHGITRSADRTPNAPQAHAPVRSGPRDGQVGAAS